VKHWFVLLTAVCAASVSWSRANPPAAKPVTVIRAGALIDGESNSARRNQVIVIRGNQIVEVSDAAAARIPDSAEMIDLSQATVLPGLIDAHTHIFLQGEDPDNGGYDIQLLKYPLAFRAARATVSVRRALDQGFTTLRCQPWASSTIAFSSSTVSVGCDTRPPFASTHERWVM
jgi:imidazolonepropionase-like amidohydrolase